LPARGRSLVCWAPHEHDEEPQSDDVEVRIDATFRNGCVTVGIILGFSLALSQRAADPIAWSQGKDFADLPSTRSLFARSYERARETFLLGLARLAAGIAVALRLDVSGLGPRTLAP
jgi:hypothetical protein